MSSAAFPFAIVGLDLDGTFLDTLDDLAAAVNHALADIGRAPLLRSQMRPMIGGGGKLMLTKALEATGGCEADELSRLYALLLTYYQVHIAVATRPYPGAVAAVDALKGRGVKLAIVTNKAEHMAEQLLAELGLRDRFETVIGGDTLGREFAKPHRAPIDEMIRRCGGGSAAFVGDTSFDIMAAKNASVLSIAVRFGFLAEPVESLGADAIIDHFDELIPTLQQLASRRPT